MARYGGGYEGGGFAGGYSGGAYYGGGHGGGGYYSGAGAWYGGDYDWDYGRARPRGYDTGYRGPGSDLGEDIRRGYIGRGLYTRSAVGPGARRGYGAEYRGRRGRAY